MRLNDEGFPEDSSPEEQERIRQDALNLIRKDKWLDDDVFTPPGTVDKSDTVSGIGPIVVASTSPEVRLRALDLIRARSSFDPPTQPPEIA